MNFGQALEILKANGRVSRAGWNGKGMWLQLQRPDAHSKMSLPYIYMSTATGDLVPWLASQTDVLAEDWSGVVRIDGEPVTSEGQPLGLVRPPPRAHITDGSPCWCNPTVESVLGAAP